MLSSTFKEQSKGWAPITRAHVSNAVLVVHDFVREIFEASCPDSIVHASVWDLIFDGVHEGCRAALDHTEFLLQVELHGRQITYDPLFNKTLVNIKATRLETISRRQKPIGKQDLKIVLSQSSRRDILDALHSYYDIACRRFIDVVCQQVIDHFLLHGPKSPFSVPSDELVLRMTSAELEEIAGEDLSIRNRRETLKREIEGLTKALKVLRT